MFHDLLQLFHLLFQIKYRLIDDFKFLSDRPVIMAQRFLGQIADGEGVGAGNGPFVKLFFLCHTPQKGRLAAAVTADNSDLFRAFDFKLYIFKYRIGTEILRCPASLI